MKKEENPGWVAVANVSTYFECELIMGILQMANITAVKKLKGMDANLAVITGSPVAEGIDVLVPCDRYEEALQLLNAQIDDTDMWSE
jgi:hypothetical protein